ncbi:hypothetical protein [Streptomyces sp. NPDC002758]
MRTHFLTSWWAPRRTRPRLDTPPGGVLGGIAIAGMATTAVGPPIGGLLVGVAG